MIVAIDLDDVLADFLTAFIEFFNENHDDKLKYSDFTAYTLNEIRGMPADKESHLLENFDKSEYFDKIESMRHSMEAIKKLAEKHELLIVTSRTISKEEKTKAWINKHFPDISKIYFTRENYFAEQKTKAEICKKIGAEILIEDNLKYANQCADAGIKVLLFDYPWNQGNLNPLITRVKRWDEIVEVLENI